MQSKLAKPERLNDFIPDKMDVRKGMNKVRINKKQKPKIFSDSYSNLFRGFTILIIVL